MNDYIRRINLVLDYIDQDPGAAFTLEELSGVANFSPFHFSRIFSSVMDETLFEYIRRRRLENAAVRLAYGETPITEIALDAGFDNSSSFSKSFKAQFGFSPKQWREGKKNNPEQANSKRGKDTLRKISNTHYNPINNTWRCCMNKEEVVVEVKEVEVMTVAYINHVGPYAEDTALFDRLFGQLVQWADSKGLINENPKFLTIYYDDPNITDEEKLQIRVCLEVPEETETSGVIGKMVIPGGSYAIGCFYIDISAYGEIWSYMYGEWLENSGYEPDDRKCFEVYLNNPQEDPEGKHRVALYVPVQSAQ